MGFNRNRDPIDPKLLKKAAPRPAPGIPVVTKTELNKAMDAWAEWVETKKTPNSYEKALLAAFKSAGAPTPVINVNRYQSKAKEQVLQQASNIQEIRQIQATEANDIDHPVSHGINVKPSMGRFSDEGAG